MPKSTPTKPVDDHDTGTGTGAGASAPLASTLEPHPAAIRAATTGAEAQPGAPSIPELLARITDIETQLAALLDDLAVAMPDLRSPAPIPGAAIVPSGAYALQPAPEALDALRERAASGDRAALLRYLRLRRS